MYMNEPEGRSTHQLRKITGLTQKEFSDEFGIPLPTIKNWDARFCMPTYVYNLIYRLIKTGK